MATNEFDRLITEIGSEIRNLKELSQKKFGQFNTLQTPVQVSFTPTSGTFMSKTFLASFPANRVPAISVATDETQLYIDSTNKTYFGISGYMDYANLRYFVQVSLNNITPQMYGNTYTTNLVFTSTSTLTITQQ